MQLMDLAAQKAFARAYFGANIADIQTQYFSISVLSIK